jgi:hypothetical protein
VNLPRSLFPPTLNKWSKAAVHTPVSWAMRGG